MAIAPRPVALDDPAVLQAIRAEIANPKYAGMTDQQICDALNAPVQIVTVTLAPPLLNQIILGVPRQPNVIVVSDLAAVRSA